MPRIRTIKPEFSTDAKLAKVSRDARLTLVLLITQADDEGLVPGTHRQLLGAIYPHDEDVSAKTLLGWVEELVDVGVVRWRATNDGSPVVEIVNWAKHQRVDNKGRSQLAVDLAPLAETSAKLAGADGGSRQLAADRGEIPLGPTTNDLRPPTVPAASRGAEVEQVRVVLDHYRRVHPKRRPGKKEAATVLRALRAGYVAADLCEAIDGNASDEWHRERGKHELTYVLRDNGLIDTFRAKKEANVPKPLVDPETGMPTEYGATVLMRLA